MDKLSENNFEFVYEAIEKLKILMKESADAYKEFELSLIQQFLDEESLYIKQIPCVCLGNDDRMDLMYLECSQIHSQAVNQLT